ncbi:putative membrane protein [Actinomadura coerulea]|uniref:Putative membrane protein n=1 Tax=Actinomadura coerulea TaxID=46159 RepID=A0A7X0KZ23_9ACTN|nr:hypothetical protein [Actinomadura coerulea]MBB6395987.1 putative membrane protein [Actinomadura coerulea]GGQ30821.1 hypothetical protein GCM10010187_54630 [Actinomadura coerulea]
MKFIGYGLLAIVIGAVTGTVFAGLFTHLVHTVQAEMLHGFGVPAGFTDSGLMAAMTGPGVSHGLVAGTIGGFLGFVGARAERGYRASYGGAAPRDNWGRLVGDGVAIAVVFGIGVIGSVGDFGLLTAFTAIAGFAAGAGFGAVIADI